MHEFEHEAALERRLLKNELEEQEINERLRIYALLSKEFSRIVEKMELGEFNNLTQYEKNIVIDGFKLLNAQLISMENTRTVHCPD